jgi:serine/threonine-protein kinase
MDPERWQRLTAVFDAALQREPATRAAFVAQACGDDRLLLADVHALLRGDERARQDDTWSIAARDQVVSSVEAGTRFGPYVIDSPIGAGGMGEVYRAHDTQLRRDVAIKILPAAFTTDPGRLARFQREARMLAALNHPHVAAIHGVEEADGLHGIILELVEGETLADRLQRGPIPLTEALAIARQIADALEAAHEKGIIHRDLKPGNIKVTAAGVVKVLDFGLAKAPGDGSMPDLAQSPTGTGGRTSEGIILGTAAYMSPEQARGETVDKRTDIWALGCVLFEMLAGQPTFARDTVTDTLAAIVNQEVKWEALPDAMPPSVRKLLHRCLAKDRRQRLSDAGDTRLELDDALNGPAAEPTVARPSPPSRMLRRAIVATGASLIIGAVAGMTVWLATRPAPRPVTRTSIVPPTAVSLEVSGLWRDVAISPDGKRVVYRSRNALGVRALDHLLPTTLTGFRVAGNPVFSPDGQWIAFINNLDERLILTKVPTAGGPAVSLTPTGGFPRGVSWGPDDTIIFATGDPSTGLLRVPAAGGKPQVLTTPDRAAGEFDHDWPEVLPGGAGVLFTIQTTFGGIEPAQVAVVDLRTGARRVLVRGGSHAQYVAPGYLIYAAGAATVRAVRFDLARLEVVGTPVPVLEGVAMTPLGSLNASVAADGTLVYVAAEVVVPRMLVWVDRLGREEPLGTPPRLYNAPRLSADGTRVTVQLVEEAQDLWQWDLRRRTFMRLTSDPADDAYPVWMPDGQRLVWASGRAGPLNVYTQAADGTGAVERLTESPITLRPTSITPDGTRLILSADLDQHHQNLMLLTLKGAHTMTPLRVSPFTERQGEVSPDGRWLAYESNETGQFEVYVRPFPDVEAGKVQVSTGGGGHALWSRSGRELFYRGQDGTVMGVKVDAQDGHFRTNSAAKLVEKRYFDSGSARARAYDVAPDGTRFLMIKDVDSTATAAPAIVVVQHWVEELKRLLPPK